MIKILKCQIVDNPIGLIFLLPGRGMHSSDMHFLKDCFEGFNVLSLNPSKEFYPSPNGPNDQSRAVNGVKKTAKSLIKVIEEKATEFNLPIDRVGLLGFSAGAVLALEISFLIKYLGFVISCSGCVLEPSTTDIKEAKTNYFLIHGKKDNVFGWESRYLPTKKLLKDLDVVFLESSTMDHSISKRFIKDAVKLIKPNFN